MTESPATAPQPLQGRVALVTGVTGGLGGAIATILLSQGARVVGAGRRQQAAAAVRSESGGTADDFMFIAADLSKPEDCARLVPATVQAHGRIDILINNAGSTGEIGWTHEKRPAEFDDVLAINLRAPYLLARDALGHMRAAKQGVILNIASVAAVEAHSHMAAYSASKAGLVQLTRALAVEYVLDGIRVNAVILGGVKSEMMVAQGDAMARFMRGPDFVRTPGNTTNSALQMEPADVAATIALLCHDDAKLITGASIAVDATLSAGFAFSTLTYMTTSELWKTN